MAGRFRLLGVVHSQGGVRYKKGDVLESKSDLDTAFPGMFVRELDLPVRQAAPKVVAPPVEVEVEGEDEAGEDDITEAAGTDVTDQFVLAEEKGVTVFQKENGKFVVFKGDEELKTLDTKTAAKAFLKSME